ncbi:MAG: hypothetical protein JXB40_00980 [Candidatus Omnitrophica bacterium]|nr:hypothetical protein [Candidatus Omnitrophota bacterium]
MPNKCAKTAQKDKECRASVDTLTERLKKVRALNCNPADVGLDCYIWKMFFMNSRSNVMTRFL